MLADVISKINLQGNRCIVTILKEHEKKFEVRRIVKKFLRQYKIETCILEGPTQSQSETICKTLFRMRVHGPFLIKDSDSIFKLARINEPYNYVAVEELENVGIVNPSNKSYVLRDISGIITNIEEKKVISNTFSAGGYFFNNPDEFVNAFRHLTRSGAYSVKEMYVSAIINHLIFNKNIKFKIKQVSEYSDLGTYHEWLAYKNAVKTFFVDIDGIIVKNSAEYFRPFWGATEGIKENVEVLKELYKGGSQIILTTSRKESYRAVTERQLRKLGIKYHHLLMDMYHSQRVLVNDFAGSNPYPSAVAVNIPRDSNELAHYLPR